MNYDIKETGKRIRILREQRKLTQEATAEYLSISLKTYGKLERGERGVSIDVYVELSELFGVSLDYLIIGRESAIDSVKKQILGITQMLLQIEQIL